MRLSLLAAALMVVLYTCLPDATRAAALSTSFPKPHLRFKERKGTMGFVYAVVLGPVGYFGVQIFSRHSDEMRYQAGRGFKFWGYLIGSCAIIMACAALGDSGNFASSALSSLWSGF
jgi:hypothetical protein